MMPDIFYFISGLLIGYALTKKKTVIKHVSGVPIVEVDSLYKDQWQVSFNPESLQPTSILKGTKVK